MQLFSLFKHQALHRLITGAAFFLIAVCALPMEFPTTRDCMLRSIAFDQAKAKLPDFADLGSVHSAMNLSECSIPSPYQSTPLLGQSEYSHVASSLVVDAVHGDDTALGDEHRPFKTLGRALEAVQHLPEDKRSVLLRGGVHYTSEETVKIGPHHSHLQLRSFPGESAVISGGIKANLEFKKVDPSSSVLVANVPAEYKLPDVNEIFVHDDAEHMEMEGTRYHPARYPNGDAEKDQCAEIVDDGPLHDDCPGYDITTFATKEYPFKNGTWFEETTVKRKSYNAWAPYPWKCPPEKEAECKASACFWVTDYFATMVGGSAAGRFAGGLSPSSTTWSQQARHDGLKLDGTGLKEWNSPNMTKGASSAEVHLFNYGLGSAWGNVIYTIDSVSDSKNPHDPVAKNNRTINFGQGGFHLTAGTLTNFKNHFFVSNLIEELDAPQEYYYDQGRRLLYLIPSNDSDVLTRQSMKLDVVFVGKPRLMEVRGVQDDPGRGPRKFVTNVTIKELTFIHAAKSYLQFVGEDVRPYEVVSNGDGSVLREAALFVGDGAFGITVDRCRFWRLGGRGIFLNNFARNITIQASEFAFLGEEAIVSAGSARLGYDGTAATYPRMNKILGNHIHDVGIFVKHSSGYTQYLSCKTLLRGNVIYNGPFSAINFNDHFGGGNVVEGNLGFNLVRETDDHGLFKMWSRSPYLTTENSDTPSTTPEWTQVRYNMHINGFKKSHSCCPFDYDDGADWLNTTFNVLVYGGFKTGWHSMHQHFSHNVIAFPDNLRVPTANSYGTNACIGNVAGKNSQHPEMWNDYVVTDNTCFTDTGLIQKYIPQPTWDDHGCWVDDLNFTAVSTARNKYYTATGVRSNATITGCNGSAFNIAEWSQQWVAHGMAAGGEFESTVSVMPSLKEIEAQIRATLAGFHN